MNWLKRFGQAWKAAGAQAKRSYYKGAEISRLTSDWVTSTVAADDEIRTDIRRLKARSRELARNNPIVRHYLGMLGINVIGATGFAHEATVADNSGNLNERINENIEQGFADWSHCVSLDGKLSLVRLQFQCLVAVARDGEVLVRKWNVPTTVNPYAFALEVIDADMLDERLIVARGTTQNEIRMGIEVDEKNRPVAYHVWDRAESFIAHPVPRKRIRVPAEEIIHLYDVERANQTRGVPWVASVMHIIRQLDGYIEAEVVAARIAADKVGWFVRRDGSPAGTLATDERGVITDETNPGSFNFAPEGYELQAWNPAHPNTEFSAFVKGMLRQVATGLRVSYNSLANDLEGVNYSSLRSGLLLERDTWRALQEWWKGVFLVPVYKSWLAQSRLSGQVSLDTRRPDKLEAATFTGRGWPWIDPLKDTEAAALAIANGLSSRTRELAEMGLDVDDVMKELAAEQELAKTFGLELATPNRPVSAPLGEKGASSDAPPEPNGKAKTKSFVDRLTFR
mgnify:FL=1